MNFKAIYRAYMFLIWFLMDRSIEIASFDRFRNVNE